jgi:chorismate mutase
MTIALDQDDATEIGAMRLEVDLLDAGIVAALTRRVEIERQLAAARVRAGAPRAVHRRDLDVVAHYRAALGPEGAALAATVLRLSRS